ncbi:hypothetical protein L7F22_011729 [Adiantum nelumboides]|nr:hypothetical protein [Adiantum nelumboides]
MEREIILIFDEMNTFGHLPNSFKDSFLATLCAMKLDKKYYCLHSILLRGTDSILSELRIAKEKRWAASQDTCASKIGLEYSSFSYDFRMKPSFFSATDIEDLLSQYAEDILIEVDTVAIAKSIFDLTSGHKGW